MKICPDHNKPFSEKGLNARGNYWHVINFDKKEFCNYSEEDYEALDGDDETPNRTAELREQAHKVAASAPEYKREKIEQPDWDAISRGKVRCQVAVAFIGQGAKLDIQPQTVIDNMEKWVDWIMDGPKGIETAIADSGLTED